MAENSGAAESAAEKYDRESAGTGRFQGDVGVIGSAVTIVELRGQRSRTASNHAVDF
jgi:hypothetical protein